MLSHIHIPLNARAAPSGGIQSSECEVGAFSAHIQVDCFIAVAAAVVAGRALLRIIIHNGPRALVRGHAVCDLGVEVGSVGVRALPGSDASELPAGIVKLHWSVHDSETLVILDIEAGGLTRTDVEVDIIQAHEAPLGNVGPESGEVDLAVRNGETIF